MFPGFEPMLSADHIAQMNASADAHAAVAQQYPPAPSTSPPRCASRLALRPPLRGGMLYNITSRSPTRLGIDDDDIVPCPPVLEEDEEDIEDEDSLGIEDDDDLDLLFFPPAPLPRPTHRCSPSHPSLLSPHRRSAVPQPSTPPPGPTRLSFLHRHLYPHRGLSRLGLAHVRGLWSSRRAAWDRWADEVAEAEEASLYGGITFQPAPSPAERDARRAARHVAPAPPRAEQHADPPPHVRVRAFPRLGDLLALRDPRGAAADWCFRRVPVWTLRKALWTHDLHARAVEAAAATAADDGAAPGPSGHAPADADEAPTRANTPDSDTTLVEHDFGWKADGAAPAGRAWEEDWLARWAVLADVLGAAACAAKHVDPRADGFDALMRAMLEDAVGAGAVVLRAPPSPARRGARFFVMGDEDEDELGAADHDELSDDEEEGYDYGQVVERPIYGRLRSQLERGRLAVAMMS